MSQPKTGNNKAPLIISASVITGIIFLVTSVYFSRDSFNPVWLLPPALLFILLAVISIENFLLLTVFLVPVSVQMRFLIPGISTDLFLPTEMMLPVILFLMIFKVTVTREIDRKVFMYPVTLIGLFMLIWSLVTSFTGTMPLVSLKSFVTRLWFFTGFYLLALVMFRQRYRIEQYFKAYLAGMIPVVIFYIIRMWNAGLFDQKATFRSIRPFFNDHTALGASLAFCIPLIIYFIVKRGSGGIKRLFFLSLLPLFSFAFVLSYSRAAWISLAAAAVVVVVIFLRISWKLILPAGAGLIIFIIVSWPALEDQFISNRQASSADLSKHLRSISNITTDDSNRERINRWKSAFRMSAERPVFGWGPGTYQFQYAPFQVSSDKTSISTNYGERGNAHSEYLGTLSESGIPGMILYILLLVIALWRGFRTYTSTTERETKYLILTIIAGLTTYVVHGALNNFLDTDKISALFWGMIAALVSIETEKQAGENEEAGDQ